jgi:hypothetical protein
MDYETYVRQNQRFQRCYIADGNKLSTYKNTGESGKLFIEENKTYKIEITIYDAEGNNATLRFNILWKAPVQNFVSLESSTGGYRLFENILKIKGSEKKDTMAVFYRQGNSFSVSPSYVLNGFPVYLYDLRNGLVDSVKIRKQTERFYFHSILIPQKKYALYFNPYKVYIPDTSLFDTLYLQARCIEQKKNIQLILHTPIEPIYGQIDIVYKRNEFQNLKKTYIALNGKKYEKTKKAADSIWSSIKYFGNYELSKDTIPPLIKFVSLSGTLLKFIIDDKESGIDSVRATLNGHFLLMCYEHKQKTIWSRMPEGFKILKGSLVLEVFDRVGNKKVYRREI